VIVATVPQLVKLGSIARHAEELIGPGGHPTDADTIRSLLQDPDVTKLMQQMDDMALLPVARGGNR
jgi:hypothetical protein